MADKVLLDVFIQVKDEKLFKVLYDAELNYHTVVTPFLQKWQIKGKILKIMGIDSRKGDITKIQKYIPFSYRRKIIKPKEKWKTRFIYLNYKPAMMYAKKNLCLKIILGDECFVDSSSQKQVQNTCRTYLESNSFVESDSTEQEKDCEKPYERRTEIHDSTISEILTNSPEREQNRELSLKENSPSNSFVESDSTVQEKDCEIPYERSTEFEGSTISEISTNSPEREQNRESFQKENIPLRAPKKFSESIITIVWPLREQRPAIKESCSESANFRINHNKKQIFSQPNFKNLKENTDHVHAKNHSVYNIDECDNTVDENSSSWQNKEISSEYNSGSGSLADLFSPMTMKRLFPRYATPVLRRRGSSIDAV